MAPVNKQWILSRSPRLLKQLLVDLEALRRSWFRRGSRHRRLVKEHDLRWLENDHRVIRSYQGERLRHLVSLARHQVPLYRNCLAGITVNGLADLPRLPVLDKEQLRGRPWQRVREGQPRLLLWSAQTSGSTGAPLSYFLDRATVQAHAAVYTALLRHHDCDERLAKVRFSGVLPVPVVATEPPFWLWIRPFRQLQCSAYHLGPATYASYLAAIRQSGAAYGTGYATCWHLLATYLAETGAPPPALRAIVTDSEGLGPAQQRLIESAFQCPVVQTYGLSEVGQSMVQCREGRYHELARARIIEVVDEDDQPVAPGGTGTIVITDLTNEASPFLRYRTGDLATVAAGPCACGWQSRSFTELVGRQDDVVTTPEGRLVGRLDHLLKAGRGIRESQIVQTAIDRIRIDVVPAQSFEPDSMAQVLDLAATYLGSSMQVSWRQVAQLPRGRTGKLRFVVREFGPDGQAG